MRFFETVVVFAIAEAAVVCIITVIYPFCSRSFKCSGLSIAIERVIWAALKKGRRPLRSGILI